MRIRRGLVPLLLVAASALAACGGGEDDDQADEPTTEATQGDLAEEPSGDSACELLSTDEVAAAVGSPVKDGIPASGAAITGGSFDTCVWRSDDPDNPADTATITIYPNAAAADSVRSDDSEAVEGIGDEAFIDAFASIWVYVGEKSFFAQWYAIGGSDEENLPESEALATAAADAL